MTMLIMYGVLAIGVSFLCSMLEACLLSLPRSYVASLEEKGNRTGVVLKKMQENIDRPLAAILTLNTIAHTVGAAGVGAQAAVVFGNAAVGLTSAIMTLLILVVSEIIPKTLGAVYAKQIASPSALTIRLMIVLSTPVIIPLEWVNKIIGFKRHQDHLSRSELLATLRLGHDSGAMQKHEFQVATNLITMGEIPVSDILTPRMVVFSLPGETSVKEALDKYHPLQFSRIPIYTDNQEDVIGYVPKDLMYEQLQEGKQGKRLEQLVKQMPTLPEYATVGDTLDKFIQENHHMALVVDEYGGMEGIVTLEDLLETLLGEEIVDETDTVEDMQELARKRARERQERIRQKTRQSGVNDD
jgi:CBS domain containing-hemolysin-like protein